MRYQALALDYDGTLAHHGQVDEATLAGLRRLLASGRKLLMVTGRRLEELTVVFPQVELFDWIVAENGAILWCPRTDELRLLAAAPPAEFLAALAQRGVQPLDQGHVILATWEPHETAVLESIRQCGLELQVIFNKGAVMILPSGTNKATGLAAALEVLGIASEAVVGMGDAENDHAFLEHCGCSAAVFNALDTLKEKADFVTVGDHGRGVVEVIEMLVRDDLAEIQPKPRPPRADDPATAGPPAAERQPADELA